MIWTDIAILSIIGLSALISLTRGFMKEAISLFVWIAAFFVASTYYPRVAIYFSQIKDEILRNGAAVVLLFISTLIVGAIVNYIIVKLVEGTGLAGTDKLLGIVFGALRGIFIVAAILFAMKAFILSPTDKKPEWWTKSELIPHFSVIDQWFFNNLQTRLKEISAESAALKTILPSATPPQTEVSAGQPAE